jgi:allophanate hydrolase subunit 2
VEIVDVIGAGLVRKVGGPAYGLQDIGFSPGGPMDRFAMQTGNIMLSNDDFAPALEIVFAASLEFRRDSFFVLIGGQRRQASLSHRRTNHRTSSAILHATVTYAGKGDRLIPGPTSYGFRSYLCVTPSRGNRYIRRHLLGRARPLFREISAWPDPAGRIRVMKGPEYASLENPAAFLEHPWITTREMSDMGVRLAPAGGDHLTAERLQMLSSPVNDGTVQLTPGGPIILMRGRQTIGGYPRIFNVIGPDVDILGQCGPNQFVHFREVVREEAVRAAMTQREDIERFRRRWKAGDI